MLFQITYIKIKLEQVQGRSSDTFFRFVLFLVKVKVKGRFLLFQVYRNFANLFFKLSVGTFYKEISKFQRKVQS